MGENTKYFWRHLPACGVFALAAAVAAALFATASDYTTYSVAVKVYSVGWFATCVLSFYCGLLVVPRSLGIIFSFAGIVAFAIVCAMDVHTLPNPLTSKAIQALPALFFIAAWAAVASSSCRSENKKIRLSAWLWLTIFVVLLSCWATFHTAQGQLLKQRNDYLTEARKITLALAADLDTYKEANKTYPPTLEDAGIDPERTLLPLTGKRIKYYPHETDYALTFADPMPCGQTALFSYDTSQDGWFGTDPNNAQIDAPCHMFLGFLRQR
ncbi:MAG: hypothetical protein DRP52_03075 [Planctomycetota bacterium]|nr:MAG: hypothetical protein DRP52_03075 [Planctomycetota bacterium]